MRMMATFIEDDKTLIFAYLRHLIRLTKKGDTFDVLDCKEDTAAPDEQLIAYQLTQVEQGAMHIKASRGLGGWYLMAKYNRLAEQPCDETMRDNTAWSAFRRQHPIGPLRAKKLAAELEKHGCIDPNKLMANFMGLESKPLDELSELTVIKVFNAARSRQYQATRYL